MLAVAIPFSPLTSPPTPPLSTSPTLWRCNSSPSHFNFSTATSSSSSTLLAPSPLPPPPSPTCRPPNRSLAPSPPLPTSVCSHSRFSLDCPSPTLSPPASPSSSAIESSQATRYLRHLPPIAQHHFYHWLHIRSLYKSQFTHYVAAGTLLPLAIHTDTLTSSRPLTFDSYRVHLTTTTTTDMPHATATTATSTSYRQLTSDVLCLPPSPPLLASAGWVPPAPFSYDFTYPSHPFSYPPAAVLEALPADIRDQDSWARYTEEEQEEEVDTEEEEGEEKDDNELVDEEVVKTEEEEQEEEEDSVDDSDDEWCGGGDRDVTEVDQRSSYAPSYAPSYACSDAEEEEEERKEVGVQAAVAEKRRTRQLALIGLSSS